MEISTEAYNAESKVEKFPVALFIITSSRRAGAHLLTYSVSGRTFIVNIRWFKLQKNVYTDVAV